MTYEDAIWLIKQMDIAAVKATHDALDPEYMKGYLASSAMARELLLNQALHDAKVKNEA